MESETVISSNGEFTEEFEGKTAQKVRVSDHIITGLQYTNRSDSFVVEMERFSHLTQQPNSRITRSQARKGSVKKTNHQNATNENSIIASSSSPRAVSHGASTPEKPMIVTAGLAADSPALQPFNNQITVVTGGDIISSSPTERRIGDKKFGFRRLPSSSWTLDPRRILLFFATLSSMGTILLIYFTLSIGTKLGGDNETALN
ncbi:PREDICTED: uncharacterized protein LOC109167093 isoform X2 [Ipomoea nil]|uniref:uncharacterized protein LOC109167093 isoform X2 n=1 Tax=Ipomoea nil TaxID=35883 RepID=UPI0009013E17|nr:PREDICTED: uncharacterized protein LOC109167093 isoform X2 [Ipomoea nil]XP_019171556.1 PREDICTED: uncharacterized protein LOC109167093 isoform X2 [Ipomoea nil]